MWCVTHGPGGKIDSLCHLTWILYTGFFQPRKCIRRRIVTCDLTSSFSLIYRQELLPNEIVKIGWLGLIWRFKFYTPVKSLFRWFFRKTTYSDNLLIHPIICIPAHGNYCIDWWLVILPWDAETDLSVHRDGNKIFRTMYQIHRSFLEVFSHRKLSSWFLNIIIQISRNTHNTVCTDTLTDVQISCPFRYVRAFNHLNSIFDNITISSKSMLYQSINYLMIMWDFNLGSQSS